jgi:phosphohistidine phosphatase SixA
MRHCLTDDGPQMDAERPLNDIGREQAKVMRKFLKIANVKPDVIVCSDFERAAETAEAVVRGDTPIEHLSSLLPDGNPEAAWKEIQSNAKEWDAESVLVVTHSPLVQSLLASVAFCFVDELWEFHHGAVAYINTDESRFRWYVNPKLAAHIVGEDPKDVENPVGEADPMDWSQYGLKDFERDNKRLVENLMADARRSTIAPLRDQMRAALEKRWRKQLRNVRRALKTHTATDYVTAAAVVATALPLHDSSFATAHAKVKVAAYYAGIDHASAQLGVKVEEARFDRQTPYGNQTSTDLEDDLDSTTVDRAHNTLKALEPFTLAAASTALGALFAGFGDPGGDKMSRADTVALNVVSTAYHDGGADAATQAADTGADVEKAWQTETNPCETCIANEAEGFIPADAPHDSGDFEPPAHPNCACSEVYRLAGEAEQ